MQEIANKAGLEVLELRAAYVRKLWKETRK